MALIHDIQNDLLRDRADLAPILLKLRLLAAKLGSHSLAEWVKHEAEGYPTDVELPDYRKLGISYTATFSGAFGSGIKNAPIPLYLINKIAGENWTSFGIRQSVAAIDQLLSADKDGSGMLHIDSSNLILLLQGQIYPDYTCIGVEGSLSTAQLREVQHVVKSRILELVLGIEQSIPEATAIGVGEGDIKKENASQVSQIFYQTVHGSMTNIANSGDTGTVNVNMQGSIESVASFLGSKGIDATDALEFSNILASEKPESKDEPFGESAKKWIAKNVAKATDGTWKVGIGVATEVLKKAALNYYGMT